MYSQNQSDFNTSSVERSEGSYKGRPNIIIFPALAITTRTQFNLKVVARYQTNAIKGIANINAMHDIFALFLYFCRGFNLITPFNKHYFFFIQILYIGCNLVLVCALVCFSSNNY